MLESYKFINNKAILRIKGKIYESSKELVEGSLFREILNRMVLDLLKKESVLLSVFENRKPGEEEISALVNTLQQLTKNTGEEVEKLLPESKQFFRDTGLFGEFVEYLYNFWRGFERYVLCDSFERDTIDRRPYRAFNDTVGTLSHLMRKTYRDIEENITGTHPRVYREVEAGAEFGTISIPLKTELPEGPYNKLEAIKVMRQVIMNPPLILEPTMNKRTGSFVKINVNPLSVIDVNKGEWLCYPARVGNLIILIYFHEKFFELGFSLCNLFDIAEDHDMERQPDAVYLFGVPGDELDGLAEFPTVFFDDDKNGIMVAACPNREEFGYFGYLKKMVLTLHNSIKIKKGIMPFHGALMKIFLRGGKEATMLLIGDSGAGKSETLEAMRTMGSDHISDIVIIADDMGSLEIDDQGNIIGFGTEIGAFLRIDDLKPGYAFGQIDRSIIMSPGRTNARIILPVTNFDNIVKGFNIDYILYANNYEEIDSDHPILERIDTPEKALDVFREGTVMSKGTTTSTGIVHSYFANIFGPPSFREEHDRIAQRYFQAFFKKGLFVGQMRTRLGIPGYEQRGPAEAAGEVLKMIASVDVEE
jgi:energy-coupling factor transporter ATP-binding protein EcfA2